ncbi:hypothetical protein SELMODRAFT_47990, partial [Selaginella moellendorffii]
LRFLARKNAQALEAKENDERDRLAKTLCAAEEHKRELFAKRNAEVEASKKANREKEKVSLESREELHARAPLNYWGAVSELISTKPAVEKKKTDAAIAKPRKSTDLSRMRQIILKLKHRIPKSH